uniref:Reverse transcriptase Ty1/copia-type domain-containing protein n=1 Tax=Solanum lycopersicum TaxID=4081 RepID=A0A3Q7HNA4_SOLLC
MYILVCVDDILITGNYPTLVAHVINSLAYTFSLKNLGEVNYFLGIEVKHIPNGIVFSQYIYILEILSDVDMADCKRVTTPMCSCSPPKAGKVDLMPMQPCIDALSVNCNTYHSRVLILPLQLTNYHNLCNPQVWCIGKKILGYLKESSTWCLQISSHSDSNLYMYADVDWQVIPMIEFPHLFNTLLGIKSDMLVL